jgi:hypothetical protein
MAAARTAVRGLSTEELQTIRDGLAAGRKPRVMFTDAAGQIAGQLGQVVELTDPSLSDEWLVVRFGKDELPFSPTDLAIPPRGTPTRRAAPVATDQPELKLTEPPVPMPRKEQQMPTKSASPAAKPAAKTEAGKPEPGKPEAAAKAEAGKPEPATNAEAAANAEAGKAEAGKAEAGKAEAGKPTAPAPRKAGRSAKPKAPAGLTVTLAYADGEWTVAAHQGSKAVAKPYLIKPAEALKMVGLLDVAAVHEAVEHIVAAERAEAEQQAEKLRTELAEVEARLAELRDAA